MNNLESKIAVRTFFKNKWYNFLNIAGLALGLAAFIFVTLYVNNETGYDRWNKNADRIFLLERELPNGTSPYTPGKLAAAVKAQCPEVEETGRINTALFQVPFYTSSGRFLVKRWVGADYSIAKIFDIRPKQGKLNPGKVAPTVLLSKQTADALFPRGNSVQNRVVTMMSKSGIPLKVAGVAETPPGNTNLTFDCIGFAGDISQGKDQSYATQIYQTYLLIRPNTDISLLSKKIDKIYKEAALTDTSEVARQALSQTTTASIYLDPLTNLHLKPHYGSHLNGQIVKGLVILALIILIITGINFTNLYISQANKRSKEVGIRKVSGVVKSRLAFQFLLEIFFQCIVALVISFGIVLIGLPHFNQLLGVNLLISGVNFRIAAQLLFTLISLTLVAGAYPSLVMAGFKPVEVLRGNQLQEGGKLSWIRSGISIVQFCFAIGFIIILIVINQQVGFMQSADTGFSAKQVVYIDNLGIYNSPEKFEPVRTKIEAISGVKSVTVASNIPGGIMPVAREYAVRGLPYSMNTISVDYEYFETLNIAMQTGRTFNSSFPGDSTNAVINEAAVKAMGMNNPIGKTVTGCGGTYKLIGVIKDVKDYGFEDNTKPTIYFLNDHCGLAKTQIMIRAEGKAIPAMLSALSSKWSDINKLDGDNFDYHFLDELYGQLFVKEQQLQTILTYFSGLAIFIAALGLFSLAANSIRLRMKEIAIRKVFGATGKGLTFILSKPFFYIVLIANILAWPISYIIANEWLKTFAYRVHLSLAPYAAAMIISVAIVAVAVCLQIIKAVKFNPAIKLKI